MKTTHTSKPKGASQCANIFQRLAQFQGKWISMLDLHRISGSFVVHSRISDLRKSGHTIEHKNERINDKIHSYYKLT